MTSSVRELTLYNFKVYLPCGPVGRQLRLAVVRDSHLNLLHGGIKATLSKVRRIYDWPCLRTDVEEYLAHCTNGKCQAERSNPPLKESATPGYRAEVSNAPMDTVAIDMTYPEYRGRTHCILSVICEHSRFYLSANLERETTAEVIKSLVRFLTVWVGQRT